MKVETGWAVQKVARATREFSEARLASRLAFNAARVPPDEGRVPAWEALPSYLRSALEAEDMKACWLIAAVEGLLPLAVAEGYMDAARMLTSIPMVAAPEVHVPRAEESAEARNRVLEKAKRLLCTSRGGEGSTASAVPSYFRVDITSRAGGTIRIGRSDIPAYPCPCPRDSEGSMLASLDECPVHGDGQLPPRTVVATTGERHFVRRCHDVSFDDGYQVPPVDCGTFSELTGPRLGQPDEIEGCE